VSSSQPIIVWFREDLRLSDNPALLAAASTGAPIVCVYVLEEPADGRRELGGASRWWLHHSLLALKDSLKKCGCPLLLRRGDAGEIIRTVVEEIDAGAVFWNRQYEPWAQKRDAAL